ncbi:molybdate ABC transporter substrate-binding protein [Cellulosimicrobium funkei]|nr:molybdate ABC transporter substrate-binding protein [Cellulosimicrobium funkei]
MRTSLKYAGVLSAAALALTACGTSEDTTLTVFAAASLGDAFEELADGFEAEHPGVEVQYNVAGSSSLAEQILAGAPADVFASANEATMDRVVEAGEVSGTPAPFATNVLALVTPPDNPAGIESLTDAAADGVRLVVCAPQVPCGDATETLAEDAGVELSPVSEESQVTDVLGKVTSGEADAGLVYATDARGAGDAVRTIGLEHAGAAVNSYPITVLRGAEAGGPAQRELAQAFVDYVLSEDGQSLVAGYGFGRAQ